MMIILGIESSCDETSAAVVRMEEGRREILSNVVASQIEIHRLYGGVVPEIASRAHIEAISGVTNEALSAAGVTLSDVECVAVTAHPGLIGALLQKDSSRTVSLLLSFAGWIVFVMAAGMLPLVGNLAQWFFMPYFETAKAAFYEDLLDLDAVA